MIELVHLTPARTLFSREKSCSTFMTSLEVIREVMNVPMEAIHAIARINGISTADDHEKNISETMLQPFIEAFERKTKNYFVNSLRNSAHLSPQELQTFTEFCKTFKKVNVSLDNVSNWNHIGKTKLREYFVERIKEKTPSSLNHHTILDIFSGIGEIDARLEKVIYKEVEPAIDSFIINDYLLQSGSEYFDFCYRQQPSQGLLEQITSSWCYHASTETLQYHVVRAQDIIKQIILSARYYIYIDDDDDHQLDTIIVNGHNDLIINSTCRMVA